MTTRRQLLFGDFGGQRADLARQSVTQLSAAFGETCLAAQGVVCRSCGEACEAEAIRFAPSPGGISRPFLQNDRCTGCGDCLPICPSSAIRLVAAARPLPPDSPAQERLA
jgi:Fe-S-cluster-containing hydrogenase component 2